MNIFQFLLQTFTDSSGKVSSTRIMSASLVGMAFTLMMWGLVSGDNMDTEWLKWLLGAAVGNQGFGKAAETFGKGR